MQKEIVLGDGKVIPKKKEKFGWEGFIFSGIHFIGFIAFSIFPIVLSVYISLTDMQSIYSSQAVHFIGFKNYFDAFNDTQFWHAIGIGFYATLGQFISLTMALCISTLLQSKVKGWGLFAVMYFIPYICSSVCISYIWRVLFSGTGIINNVIAALGGETVRFFDDGNFYMIIFLSISAWHAPGYGIIMYNAAYTTIDDTLYEAASIDGASRGKMFTAITLPCLSSTTYYLIMLGIIGGLQSFEIFQIVNQAGSSGAYGPNDMGMVPLFLIYQYRSNKMGVSATLSWFLFFIVFAVSKLDEKFSKVWVANEYE